MYCDGYTQVAKIKITCGGLQMKVGRLGSYMGGIKPNSPKPAAVGASDSATFGPSREVRATAPNGRTNKRAASSLSPKSVKISKILHENATIRILSLLLLLLK